MIDGKIHHAMVAGEFPVLVSLGRHDMDLAKAAVDAGVFGIKFHLNAYHRATGNSFGSFAEEGPFIEKLAKLGKPIVTWQLIVRMRRFGSRWAFDFENGEARILKLAAIEFV